MLKALSSRFPNLLGTSSGSRVEFYDKFQRETDRYDRDFAKKYDEDLDTTLMSVSILFAHALVAVFIWFSWGYGPVFSPQLHPFHYRRSAKPPTGLSTN